MRTWVGLIVVAMFMLVSCGPSAGALQPTPISVAPTMFLPIPSSTPATQPKVWPDLHNGWTVFKTPAFRSSEIIYDPQGYLWAISDDLIRWNIETGAVSRYKLPSALAGSANKIVLFDTRVWIANDSGMVSSLVDGQWITQSLGNVATYAFSITPGRLWLSGRYAFYYLDGKDWKEFDSIPERYKARDGWIGGVTWSKDGSLWFLAAGLVIRFDGAQWQDYPNLLGVQKLVPLSDGTLLFVFGNGITSFDGNTFLPVTFPGIQAMSVQWSLLTSDGALLMRLYDSQVHRDRLYTIHNGAAREVEAFSFKDRPAELPVTQPNLVVPQGWVFSLSGRFSLYNGKAWRDLELAQQSPVTKIMGNAVLGFSPDGDLWTSNYQSLVRFDGVQTEIMDRKQDCLYYSSYGVANWFIGPESTIWTWGGGEKNSLVCRFDPRTQLFMQTELFFAPTDLAISPAGDLWAASSAGFITNLTPDYLRSGDYRDLKLIRIGEGLVDYLLKPSRILIGRDESIWVFAENAGLYRYDGKAWKYYGLADLGDTSALAISPDGAVWAGFAGGLLRHDGQKWVSYSQACITPSDLLVAADGAVWFKNGCDGVYRFDGLNWTHFEKGKELGGIIPDKIMQAPDGAMWFFSSNGWARYKP